MNGNVVSVGIYVDDVQYHGSALDRHTGEVLDFCCRPTLKGVVGQLTKVNEYFGGARLKPVRSASTRVVTGVKASLPVSPATAVRLSTSVSASTSAMGCSAVSPSTKTAS